MIKDNIIFLKEFINEFQSTGAPFPTSKWAARALICPLKQRCRPSALKALELGPGTGSVTVRILEQLREQDSLTVCEINPRFLSLLRAKLNENPHYHLHRERVTFYGCAVQELPEDQKYDVIICALPFLNFDLPTVENIFAKLKRLSTDETIMTYYEYIGLRSVSLAISPPRQRQRMKELDSFFKGIFSKHLSDRFQVWFNLLPINIYMLKHIDELKIAV